jgi:aspartyl-tRNA(Asn)/glutamyl-tRNA(Gln) amidotransferase subunit B
MEYEPVIGLEIHAQLLTATKLFCGCPSTFGSAPNANVCPVCLGLPGTLPTINELAVRLAVRAALALGCTIARRSVFARKQYFYPDLPKGYQVSQYEEPYSQCGHLDVQTDAGVRRVRITRIHMEEDAGKSVHGLGGDSLVDLNRAGTPLIEIVSEPDLRTSAEAAAYMRAIRDILMFIGVNDGNLEEGSFRCDANVSVRPRGSDVLGTRTELKNLNSFRFVQRAIDVEVKRQVALLDGGGRVIQETRSFDPATATTRTLRSKEEAHDYRYLPDPDLPPLVLDEAFVEAERSSMPWLPAEHRRQMVEELGITEATAATLTQHPAVARYFDECQRLSKSARGVANWVQTEVLREVQIGGLDATFPLTPTQLAELVDLVEEATISGKQAKEVFAAVKDSGLSPRAVVEEQGMKVLADTGAIEALCREVLAENDKQARQYRAGKTGLLGYFVGQVMKRSGGSADPKQVSAILTTLLEADG